MYRATEGTTVTSGPLPSGDAGVRKTLAAMIRLADQGSRDLDVRNAVIRAVSMVPPHNIPRQVRAWFEFVRDRIYFLHDPHGTEWLQSPRVTLQAGAGDCDDRAVLLAAGLRAFGVPAMFKVVAVDRRRPGSMSHVYVVANLGGRQIALDPTYGQNNLGDEPPRPSRTWMVPV